MDHSKLKKLMVQDLGLAYQEYQPGWLHEMMERLLNCGWNPYSNDRAYQSVTKKTILPKLTQKRKSNGNNKTT